MECVPEANLARCRCTEKSCERRGNCCKCVAYHQENQELPACFFPPEIERTYDRSYKCFANYLKSCGI